MFTKHIGTIAETLRTSPHTEILNPELNVLTPEEIYNNLKDPQELILRFSEKLVTEIPDRKKWSNLFRSYSQLRRELVNSLDKTSQIKIIQNKLFPHESALQNFTFNTYGTVFKITDLTNFTDLSSSQSNSVFLLEFDTTKIILKYSTSFLGKFGRIENEYFVSQYLQLLKFKNAIHTSSPQNGLVFMEYIDGTVSNKMFNKNKLLKRYQPIQRKLLLQLARYAAAFDMIGKGDRTLNLEDSTNVFGNFILKDNYLYSIDNDFLFNDNWEYLKVDAAKADLEATFLLTSTDIERDKAIFKEEYLRTIKKIKLKQKEIRQLIKNIYPNEYQEKQEIFNNFINSTKKELIEWLDLIMSQELLAKSLELILNKN